MSVARQKGTARRFRTLSVIARMNVGGPAHHVAILDGGLARRGHETLLVSGRLGPGEASFEDLAERHGARYRTLAHLTPEVRPLDDLRTLVELVRLIRSYAPDVVHTHTAKAGMLGRVAARLAYPRSPRPVLVHTFHGHVLRGYFGPLQTAAYRAIERLLARTTDRIVTVSAAVADDLVRLRVARPDQLAIIPLGLELDALLELRGDEGAGLRGELGIPSDAVVLASVGRLAPIKRVDVLLEAVAAASTRPHLLVVGDGKLRSALEQQAAALGIESRVHFRGFRRDLARHYAAADFAVLSSDNEGTPVSLIEAAAAGLPAVATDVGGVGDVVGPETGRLVRPGSVAALAAGIDELAADAALRRRLGAAARTHVSGRYTPDRLVSDVEELLAELLATRL